MWKIKEYLEITGTPEEAYTLQGEKEYVEIIKTEHTKYLDAYGCKLTIKGKTIIYTGDTNTLEPYRPYLKSADELYVDVSKFRRSAFKNRQYHRRIKKRKNNGTDIYLMHMDDKEYIKRITESEFLRSKGEL